MKTIDLKMYTVNLETKHRYCLICLEVVKFSYSRQCGCEAFNQDNTMFLSKYEHRERKINKICQNEQ